MFQRLLGVLEDMETGRIAARDSAGEYLVLAYRPVDSWGDEICQAGPYDDETEILELARAGDLHAAIRTLIDHLASIEQLEMAREMVGHLEGSGIADAAAEARLTRALADEPRRLFAYWALTFMSLDVERFEERTETPDGAIVLFSWSAKPPYHDDGITVVLRAR